MLFSIRWLDACRCQVELLLHILLQMRWFGVPPKGATVSLDWAQTSLELCQTRITSLQGIYDTWFHGWICIAKSVYMVGACWAIRISKSLCLWRLPWLHSTLPALHENNKSVAKGQLCSVPRVHFLANVAASATSYKLLGLLNALPFFTTCVLSPSFPHLFECLSFSGFSVTSLEARLLVAHEADF